MSLSILQLVKLVYLAHGWSLGFDRGPLINATAEAWERGPVIPRVYNFYRKQGIHNINGLAANEWGGGVRP